MAADRQHRTIYEGRGSDHFYTPFHLRVEPMERLEKVWRPSLKKGRNALPDDELLHAFMTTYYGYGTYRAPSTPLAKYHLRRAQRLFSRDRELIRCQGQP